MTQHYSWLDLKPAREEVEAEYLPSHADYEQQEPLGFRVATWFGAIITIAIIAYLCWTRT